MKNVIYLFVALMALAALPAQAVNFMDECEPDFFTGAVDLKSTKAVDPFSIQIGDVNADGQISIADVTLMIDILLGQFANYDTRRWADVNHDGSLTISDVTILIDYLLGGELPKPVKEGYDYVWDDQVIPEIHLNVSVEEWNKLLAFYDANKYTAQYVMANITFIKEGDTTRVDSVGLRLRGNTSRHRPEGNQYGVPHQTDTKIWRRVNFGVNLRKYVDDDDHTIDGIRKIHLRCCSSDPSYVREMFSYNLFTRAGIWTASRDIYCRLWIHVEGDAKEVYFGVYQLLEPIDKRYLKDRKDKFGSSNSYLWKCRSGTSLTNPNGDIWYDDDSDDRHAYTLETQTEEFDTAKVQLVDFMNKLTNLTDEEFYVWIQQVTDVDLLLHTSAINVALGSWDDYWNHANNYYMYFSGKGLDDYKFFFIPYDYDSTLGTCTTAGAQNDAGRQNPLNWGLARNPLIYRIIKFEDFREIYVRYLLEAVDEQHGLMDRESAQARINGWYARIAPYISNDTNWEMAIEDKPAAFGTHPEYNLMNNDGSNFFNVKAQSINSLRNTSE